MIRRCGLIETFAEFSYGPQCSVPRRVKWNRTVLCFVSAGVRILSRLRVI